MSKKEKSKPTKNKALSWCALDSYKVKILHEYSYLNEDGDFVDDSLEKEEIMSGYDFMHKVLNILNDNECIGLTIVGNEMHIEMFNPMTGEGDDWYITFEEIEEFLE